MKKFLLLTIVAVLVLGTAGYAYAQAQSPRTLTTGTSSDGFTSQMMGGTAGHGLMGSSFGVGMMGTASGTGDGTLHDYIVQAFSDATGLPVDEINTRLADGETLSDIALSLGYTLETFRTLMDEVMAAALAAAVLDGVIDQDQADWMLSHMSQTWQGELGAGGSKSWRTGAAPQDGTGTASCNMNGSLRGSGQGMRGAGRNGTGTCLQTP